MPFTPAHPAAVLPLRRVLPLSALAIGSMTPDLEFPLRLAAVSRFSHTLPAVLYFCVPAGLLLYVAWKLLIRAPALLLLPGEVRCGPLRRSGEAGLPPFRRMAAIVLAIAVGALTHISWDSFTHDYGWVVGRWPLLQSSLFCIGSHDLRVYKLLQWGSSVAGLAVIGLAYIPGMRRPGARHTMAAGDGPRFPRRAFRLAIVLLTLAFSTGMALLSILFVEPSAAPKAFATQFAICGMIAFGVCLVVYSILVRVAGRD